MQSQLAEQPVIDLTVDEKPRIPVLSGNSVEAVASTDFDLIEPTSLGYSDFYFEAPPITPDPDLSLIPSYGGFWSQKSASGFIGPFTEPEVHTVSLQTPSPGFLPNDRSWDGTYVDEIGTLVGPFSHNQSKYQATSGQRNATEIGVGNLSDPFEHNAEIPKTSPSPEIRISGKGSWERNHSSSLKDHKSDIGKESGLMKCKRTCRNNKGQKPLSCPFHKKNPQRHQNCSKFNLRRIKDVKQHIYRHHCKPAIYCPRCSQDFKYPSERDDHIRKAKCVVKEVPHDDGIISENQRQKLRNYSNRGTSIEEQWMELWKLLFPRTKPPRSPHVEAGQAELLSCLRGYWDDNADQIIMQFLSEQEIGPMSPALIKRIVDLFWDRFEGNSAEPDPSSNGERSSTPEQRLASESWFGDELLLGDMYQQSEIDPFELDHGQQSGIWDVGLTNDLGINSTQQ
ncbi:hypothetical protein ANO14919_061810 [Xylariales sp. No.14919]|nr:hypothetical protein ANO14919_061810 [Xylariales sp. No.14919]